ncbi:MAG: hypothetical protein LBQ93_02715 [Treponema sp.]|nr:hypothetical protein [Treponema sp.]
MTLEKYKDLSKKNPQEAAEIVGVVEKRNYLAHTIRDIELAILQAYNKHYHIITYTSLNSKKSKIIFFDRGCEIRLSFECEEMDERKIRLILAHELGHLVHNIDKLKNPEILENTARSDEEEIYAWKFAYHLIDKKSTEHKNDMHRGKFVYNHGELKESLTSILKNRKPEICDGVIRSLSA